MVVRKKKKKKKVWVNFLKECILSQYHNGTESKLSQVSLSENILNLII